MLVLADAIVVLGCLVRPHGEPSPVLRRRLALANQAYSGGLASRIVVSGGRRHGGHLEADVMRSRLLQEGIPEMAILVESRSMTTLENAYYSAQLLRRHGLQRVMIAT
ncbi:MAG: YdcF family protein, partial [Polyangiaceae bacterium]